MPDSTVETPVLQQNAPKTISQALKQAPRRRLVAADLDNIARLVSTRKRTEREACLMLGINPDQWYVWKSRNKHSARFEGILVRMKADYVEGLVRNIEDVGAGIGVKQPDWRANAWLAERLEPERFGQQQNVSAGIVANVQVNLIAESFKRLLPEPVPAKTIEAQEVKAIEGPKEG